MYIVERESQGYRTLLEHLLHLLYFLRFDGMVEPAYGVLEKYKAFMDRDEDPKFEFRGGENRENYNSTQYKMLFDAAANGDTKTVLGLAKTININLGWSSQEDSVFGNSKNFTPLWVAARNGHTGSRVHGNSG